MRISNAQFEQIVADHWRQRVDRALHKAVPEYRAVSQELRDDFLALALDDARDAGFITALLASGLPEFRRLHAMNGWLDAAIREPGNPAAADAGLRKAFEMTHAWGRGTAGSR